MLLYATIIIAILVLAANLGRLVKFLFVLIKGCLTLLILLFFLVLLVLTALQQWHIY